MISDTSGSWGCGAWHRLALFQLQWDNRSRLLTIAEKELIPIIVGCAVWGRSWSGCLVECHCDNQVVLSCIRSRSSRHKGLMHLLCCLVFVEARLQFAITPLYIHIKANDLADDLSRNNLASFLSKVPQAAPAGPASRLDQSDLAPSVRSYFQRGLATSTQLAYKAGLRKFYTFYTKYTISTPFPVTEQLLCYFSAYMADKERTIAPDHKVLLGCCT